MITPKGVIFPIQIYIRLEVINVQLAHVDLISYRSTFKNTSQSLFSVRSRTATLNYASQSYVGSNFLACKRRLRVINGVVII